MAVDPLIELRDVDKHSGDLHVLQDIGLTVDGGGAVVVIGPSGSGKSTPCRAVNRLETVRSGTIPLDGQPLPHEGKAPARLRADVGTVFQPFGLFAHETVPQNVSPASASPVRRTSTRRGSRAVSSRGYLPGLRGAGGGWRSRGRRPWSRRRCCSTSRPPPRTRR
ncbi:hypothetical protein GCM10010415_20570 [Streptomyces atrovirens]